VGRDAKVRRGEITKKKGEKKEKDIFFLKSPVLKMERKRYLPVDRTRNEKRDIDTSIHLSMAGRLKDKKEGRTHWRGMKTGKEIQNK